MPPIILVAACGALSLRLSSEAPWGWACLWPLSVGVLVALPSAACAVCGRKVALAAALSVTVAVALLDVGLCLYCRSCGLRYATVAADPVLARRTFVERANETTSAYGIPYEGAYIGSEPGGRRRQGEYGRGVYAEDGRFADGYVFSLENALSVVVRYEQAKVDLERALDGYCLAVGRSFADYTEALVDLRARAAVLRETLEGERSRVSAADLEALWAALAADVADSEVLALAAPLLAARGGVDVADLLRRTAGELGDALALALHLEGVRLYLDAGDELRLRLTGGAFGEAEAFALNEAGLRSLLAALVGMDEESAVLLAAEVVDLIFAGALADAAEGVDTIAAVSASVLSAWCGQTTPLYLYYDALDLPEGGAAFVQAAVEYDRALTAGGVHGALVGSPLLGALAPSYTLQEADALLREVRYAPFVYPLASTRYLLAAIGTPLVALCLCLQKGSARATAPHRRRERRPKAARSQKIGGAVRRSLPFCPLLSFAWGVAVAVYLHLPDMRAVPFVPAIVLTVGTALVALCRGRVVLAVWLVFLFLLGLGARVAAPAMSQLSYGVCDGAQYASSPRAVEQVAEARQKCALVTILGGRYLPELGYERLSRRQDGEYADPEVREAYRLALADPSLEAGSMGETIWRYYVAVDPYYALSLTPEAEDKRRAFVYALTERVAPACEALCRGNLAAAVADGYAEAQKGVSALDPSAVALVLRGRASPPALARLVLGGRGYGALDALGEPVVLARRPLADLPISAEGGALADALAALASEDLQLPLSHEALAAVCGTRVRLAVYREGEEVCLALYPTRYLEGVVGYVDGTLVRYGWALALLAALLPLGDLAWWLLPLAILCAANKNEGRSPRYPSCRKRYQPKRRTSPETSSLARS